MATPTPQQQFSTVIGKDAKFKGELQFEGGVRVDGEFEGGIKTSGQVLVSQGGKMKAEIEAGTITVEGSVEGNLVASDRVELNASGRLNGDLKAATLTVKEGAVFIGRCEVGGTLKTPQKTEPMRAIADAAAGKK
jgi:cytoskeletal protein CcmA (bactofilin family)